MKYARCKRILCLFPGFDKINVTKDYGPLSLHLSRLGYDVKILTFLNDSNKKINNINGVEVIKLRGKHGSHYSIHFPLFHFIIKNRRGIDCIVASFNISNVIASIIFKLINKGICIVKMDSDGRLYRGNLVTRMIKRFIGELIFRILSFTATLIIIETPEARKRVLNLHSFLKNKLILLPFGIDKEMWGKLSKDVRKRKHKKILFTGRAEYGKGVDLLIEAFSRLKDKYPEWKLEIDGEIMPSFKDEIMELTANLKDRVTLSNSSSAKELAEKYAQSEIFCFPSRHFHSLGPESFGVVLLEAMFFNNAIIASNAGASEYVLDYGNAGLIFQNEDVDDLTLKLEKLMIDGNLREKLAKNARSRCVKLFDWEKIVGELDQQLKKIKLIKSKEGAKNIEGTTE